MKVEIYTKITCGFCYRAKALLEQKGVEFREIRIDSDEVRRDEMIARSGRYTVPQIFINDQSIGGCDDLYALHAQNKLDALLTAA